MGGTALRQPPAVVQGDWPHCGLGVGEMACQKDLPRGVGLARHEAPIRPKPGIHEPRRGTRHLTGARTTAPSPASRRVVRRLARPAIRLIIARTLSATVNR